MIRDEITHFAPLTFRVDDFVTKLNQIFVVFEVVLVGDATKVCICKDLPQNLNVFAPLRFESVAADYDQDIHLGIKEKKHFNALLEILRRSFPFAC
jgi:hypothetical protein